MGSGGRGLIRADEHRAVVLLRLLPGAGDRRIVRLLKIRGTARAVLNLGRRDFAAALGPKAESARRDPRVQERAANVLKRCEALRVKIVPLGSAAYPSCLMGLVDPPPVLFLRGDRPFLDRRSVAVVGSRRATAAGRRTAERISRELSELGVTVVSGLALGIDGAAHRGALAAHGGTVAVLGSGPDRAYPAGNRHLFRAILERGLLVSEFPPGEPARPHHFPRRNRILAGLSAGVVVVEAARKSGAFITVDHALDLGLEVFAVPGSIEMTQSEGANALIQDGAHLLTRGSEVLDVIGWRPMADPGGPLPGVSEGLGKGGHDVSPSGLDADLVRVRAAFGREPRVLDQLVPDVGLSAARILAALTHLELRGSVARTGDGWSLTQES